MAHPYSGWSIEGWRLYAGSITSSSFRLHGKMTNDNRDDDGLNTSYPDQVSFIANDPDGI